MENKEIYQKHNINLDVNILNNILTPNITVIADREYDQELLEKQNYINESDYMIIIYSISTLIKICKGNL